jgi:uroporphyrin-III C-methyltransferase
MSDPRNCGVVHLVGAGPGAPDLLTVRAARLLARADIVFYDALVHPETLALAERAEKIAVGKRCGKHSTRQRFINKRLIDAARKHAVVVRLKGGDPMLFGRAQEELDALIAAGIRCEVVPGVTAALAASADLQTSLTRRGVSRNVAFVTPRVGDGEDASDWVKSVCSADTTVMYMAAGQAPAIATTLIENGLSADMPVVIVENASLPDMTKTPATLGELRSGVDRTTHGGPALLMIGRVFQPVWSGQAADKEQDIVRQVLAAATGA